MKLKSVPAVAALMALGGAWLATPPSHALSAKQVNVADLVRQSGQIVSGTVTAVDQGIDDHGLPYTQVQLKVAQSIRGTAAGTLTFRQFGLQTAQPAANGRRLLGLVAGMPRYEKNDQVLLFLTQTSSIGFRTTVGLEQGHFALRGGNFENGANNAALFRGVDLSRAHLDAKESFLVTTQQGAVNADTFIGLVRRAVRENWWGGRGGLNPKLPGSKLYQINAAHGVTP
jgi:hypothetical protein